MAKTPDELGTLWLNNSESAEDTALIAERKDVVNIDVGTATKLIDKRLEIGEFENLEHAKRAVSGFGEKFKARFEAAFADFFVDGVVDPQTLEEIGAGQLPSKLLAARDQVGGAPGAEDVQSGSPGGGSKGLTVHPKVAKALARGRTDGDQPVAILGYAGKSDRPGHVRIYQTLDDLSEFIDVPDDGILDAIEVEESIAPNGACSFVVAGGTEVHFGRTLTASSDVNMLTGQVLLANLSGETAVVASITTITTLRTISVRWCTPGGKWVTERICTRARKSICTCWACGATATGTVVSIIECRDAIETYVGVCATKDPQACYSALECRPTDPVMCTDAGCTQWRCAPTQFNCPQPPPRPTQPGICPDKGGSQGGN